MDFKKYIENLRKFYKVEETGRDTFKISKNGRQITTSPSKMFEEAFLEDFFGLSDLSLRRNSYFLDDKIEGDFGGIGEDDLLPKMGHKDLIRGSKPKGSVPSPDIFNSSKDESLIKKDPFSPLHGKKGPDPDHLKKPGDEDDPNKFFY